MTTTGRRTATSALLCLLVVTVIGLGCSGIDAFCPVSLRPARSGGVRLIVPKANSHTRSGASWENYLAISPWHSSSPSEEEERSYNNNEEATLQPQKRPSRWLRWRKRVKSFALAVATATSVIHSTAVPPAMAAAPLVKPLRKQQQQQQVDPVQKALDKAEGQRRRAANDEAMSHQKVLKKMEIQKGSEARQAYEKRYAREQLKKRALQRREIAQLKKRLLHQGICPFADPEGIRQVKLLEKGVDLASVAGSVQHAEKKQARNVAAQRENPRFIIKCIVEDLERRGRDPVAFFEENQDKTVRLLNREPTVTAVLANEYRNNLREYGRITKAEVLQARQAQGQEANPKPTVMTTPVPRSSIASEKKGPAIPIISAAAVVVAGGGGGAFAIKAWKEKKARDKEERQRQFKAIVDFDESEHNDEGPHGSSEALNGAPPTTSVLDVAPEPPRSEPPRPGTPHPEPKVVAPKVSVETQKDKQIDASDSPRRRLKAIFSKKIAAVHEKDLKKNAVFGEADLKTNAGVAEADLKTNAAVREADLNALLTSSAEAPDLAKLIAKLLTYGAPGRFPQVTALSGGMPLKRGFDLEKAKELVVEASDKSGLTKERAAEVFASVVHCMVINIIDLAATSLNEKEDKTTVEALNVVIDFMDHAATLFDSVAKGAIIAPVTYGGTLDKSKQEQMFGLYASPFTTSLDVTPDRIDTLQLMFDIDDKTAESILQKVMRESIMKISLGGAEGGAAGFPEIEADMGPSELKQCLTVMKEMLDSGAVSRREIEVIRCQFQETYGSDMDELMAAAEQQGDELGEDEKELLDLMKSILQEDCVAV